jgi:hypothetical protein
MTTKAGDIPDSIVDLINDLKAENAELRRSLMRVSSVPDDSSGQSTRLMDIGSNNICNNQTSGCRACAFLESQVERLSSEIEQLRTLCGDSSIANDTRCRHLMDALSKENNRRMRMESIIQRQQVHIRELMAHVRNIAPVELAEEDNFYPGEYHSQSSRQNEAVWELDMDDLNRQLEELDETVHRVEESSTRLTSTTRVAFGQGNPQGGARKSDLGLPEPSTPGSRGVLGRLMHGT